MNNKNKINSILDSIQSNLENNITVIREKFSQIKQLIEKSNENDTIPNDKRLDDEQELKDFGQKLNKFESSTKNVADLVSCELAELKRLIRLTESNV
jgi:hypothetical protein